VGYAPLSIHSDGGILEEIRKTDMGVIIINESLKCAGFESEELNETYYDGICSGFAPGTRHCHWRGLEIFRTKLWE
jgi:hypothetical protein